MDRQLSSTPSRDPQKRTKKCPRETDSAGEDDGKFTRLERLVEEGNASEVRAEVDKLSSDLRSIPDATHESLVRFLSDAIHRALELDVRPLSAPPGEKRPRKKADLPESGEASTALREAMDAGITVFSVMQAEGVPQVVVEEPLDDVLSLMKRVTLEHVFPAADPTFAPSQPRGDAEGEEEASVGAGAAAATKKRGRRKQVGPPPLSFKVCEMMDKFAQLAARRGLQDNALLAATSCCLPAFTVGGKVQEIQLSALRVLRAVFSRYPAHREDILRELLASLACAPSTGGGGTTRAYKLNGSESSVHVATALTLQLFQSCGDEDGQSDVCSSYEKAVACAKSFVAILFALSGKGTGHCFLTVFTQDLLTLLNLPEWPSAEVVLHVLTSALTSAAPQQRILAVDLLGAIGARLRVEARLSQQPVFALSAPPAAGEQNVCPACKRGVLDGEGPVLVCDDCERQFHVGCAGPTAAAAATAGSVTAAVRSWRCSECAVLRSVREQWDRVGAAPGSSGDSASQAAARGGNAGRRRKSEPRRKAGDEAVLRQLLLNYLSEESRTDQSFHYARRFFLSQWCAEEQRVLANAGGPATPESQIFAAQWNEEPPLRFSAAAASLPREATIRISRKLAAGRVFSRSFDAVLTSVLKAFSDPQASLRARAVKSLAEIVDAEPSVLAEELVGSAVHAMLKDVSVAVRLHTVELVGRHLLKLRGQQQQLRTYFDFVKERLLDTGISVRKQAVKIFRDVCLSPEVARTEPSLVAVAVEHLAKRMSDEDTVRELVLQTFQQLWFSSPDTAAARAPQLVDVVAASQKAEGGIEWLGGLLAASTATDSGRAVCSRMCRALVDMLLADDERLTAVDDERTRATRSHTASTLCSLHMFCAANPSLVVPFVPTLLPYLQRSQQQQPQQAGFDEREILRHVVAIVEATLPLLQSPPAKVVEGVESDLLQLVARKGMLVVQASIRCLCVIVDRVSKRFSLLEETFDRFFTFLAQYAESLGSKAEPAPVETNVLTQRYLYALGLLCQHFDFEKRGVPQRGLAPGSVCRAVRGLYEQFFIRASHDPELFAKALQGIGAACARWPALCTAPGVAEAFSRAVLPDSPVLVKEATLVLVAELLGEGKQGADAGGAIAQEQSARILSLVADPEPRVRLLAVAAVELIARHGLVDPQLTVPALVAALADRVPAAGSRALRTLCHIEERFAKCVSSKLFEGVELSYRIQRLLGHGAAAVRWDAGSPRPVFAELYRILRQRQARQSFINCLMRPFKFLEDGEAVASGNVDLGFLRYVSEIAAFLPFATRDEPASLIAAIDRIVLLRGGDIASRMKAAIRTGETARAEATVCRVSAIALLLLMTLKQFLRSTYGASVSRAQTPAAGEQRLGVEIETVPFAAATRDPFSDVNLGADDAQLYKHFKSLLQTDDADPTAMATPGILKGKRGRPPKHKAQQQQQQQPVSKKRKRGKGKAEDEGEEDDDDEDEDYFSGRR